MAEQTVRSACEAAGPDVPAQWVAQVMAHDVATRQIYRRSMGVATVGSPQSGEVLREAYAKGMPADWASVMLEERGEAWVPGCVQRYAEGLTVQELARLEEAGLAGTLAKAMAYRGCDTQEVRRWVEAAVADPDLNAYLARYGGHPGIGLYVRDGVSLSDVMLCHELGVEPGLARHGLTRPDGTVETGAEAIRELAEYAKACGQSTDEAQEGIRLGVPAATVKAFGPKVAPREIADFEAAGVPAKVARSLRGRDRSITAERAGELHAAGISTGADYKAWLVVASPQAGVREQVGGDYDEALRVARAGVPLATAQRLRAQSVPVGSIVELHAAGVQDLDPWSAALHGPTQQTARMHDPVAEGLHHIAAFVKAGGTPQQLARAQRAGVLLAQMVRHVDSTRQELWAAGEPNRAAAFEDAKRLHRDYGGLAGQPQPWTVTGPEDL